MTTSVGSIFKKLSELTHLIRHKFSGKPDELQAFLEDYNFVNLYCPLKMVHNFFIEVVAHITQGTRSDLQGGSNLKTWDKLKEYLKKKYNQLCEQLSCIEQKSSEKSEQYANRIRHLIWKAKEAASTEGKDVKYATKLMENLTLNRFKHPSLLILLPNSADIVKKTQDI